MSKLTIFVACPYTLFPLDDYNAAFSAVGKLYDVKFQFANEKITSDHLLTKVGNLIRDCQISLFDITGWNANVAMELGIAVGLGRRFFILHNHKIDQHGDVPSDIRGIDRIQYASNSELEAKLIILIKQELPPEDGRSNSTFDMLKSSIVETLNSSPGLGLAKLAEAAGEDKLLIQSSVRAMVASGELKTRGEKKGTKYYTAATDMRTVGRR